MPPIILYNGKFIAFTKKPLNIEAILVDKGLIKKIFSAKEKLPSYIKKIDFGGNYVVPGFIDSHTHLISKGIELQRINLENCISLDECLEKLRSAVHEDIEIVFGSNWDDSKWQKGEMNRLSKNRLDKISKKKPIIMRRVCGHCAVVNTKALNFISRQWTIVNRQNGYLYEDIALNLNEIFKPSGIMLNRAIDLATEQALSNGITSVHEITNPQQFTILQKIHKARKLKLRVAVYIPLKYFDHTLSIEMLNGLGDNFLKIAGIKIFADGSIGAQTAALIKPYINTKKRGKILIMRKQLIDVIKIAENKGLQLMIHALGDRTIKEILKIFKGYVGVKNPSRHRLEHIELLDDMAIEDMARMNLIASMQPNFVRRWQGPGGLYEQHLGARYKEMNCFKKIAESGIKIIFGSDCMPLGPLYGLEGAINHPFKCGRLSSVDAFRLYIPEGAYGTFDENKKGTIETGKFADLVVLDKNPLKEKDLDKVKILMVFVAGVCVHTKHGSIT